MKKDSFPFVLLFDFYGELLTEKQRRCFDLYYNEDLSLAEIAESEGISRQGVRDNIIRGERTLTEIEAKTKLVDRFLAYNRDIERLNGIAEELNNSGDERLKAISAEIDEIARRLKE